MTMLKFGLLQRGGGSKIRNVRRGFRGSWPRHSIPIFALFHPHNAQVVSRLNIVYPKPP